MKEINKIHNENCLTGLSKLEDKSVHCCVTSPPYFGLRDYGNNEQLGLEPSPELYVENMVTVFNEVKRVLRDDGTLWLNLGDTYNGSKRGNTEVNKNPELASQEINKKTWSGAKRKDLIGIPWLVAFALRSAGWYLRQDIIWHKPNPMPDGVKDRCTKAHEYIFLMSKNEKYYYDADSIKTESKDEGKGPRVFGSKNQEGTNRGDIGKVYEGMEKANKRSVWTVGVNSFKEAHFATFPEDLIVDCIKAGCPEGGVVLDPFMGAGTTGLVARKLNRNYIGFEINPDYVKIAETRITNQIGLFI